MPGDHVRVAELGVQFGHQIRPAPIGGRSIKSATIGGDGLDKPAAGLVLTPGDKLLGGGRDDFGQGRGGGGRRGHGGTLLGKNRLTMTAAGKENLARDATA
jgi:hypothetical protein